MKKVAEMRKWGDVHSLSFGGRRRKQRVWEEVDICFQKKMFLYFWCGFWAIPAGAGGVFLQFGGM